MKTTFWCLILTVLLGGSFLPVHAKTPIKLYLLAGQSNMVGNGDNNALPAHLQQLQHNVPIKVFGTANFGWGPDRPGLGSIAAVFGAEVTFGYDMATALPGQQIGIIKGAWSGTNLYAQWRSPSAGGTTGELYTSFVNQVRTAITELQAQYDVEIAGVCWMQGESDASDVTMANAYQANLTAFIADIRREFGVPALPFVMGMIDVTASWPYNATVRQAEVNVSNTIANVYRFDTQDYPTDGSHYYAAGYMQLGSDFARVMPKNTSNTQSPYAGVINLPGVVEAENFDNGGEGIAYHDTDAGNLGSQYRTSQGVDIQACTEGGFNVGWTNPGEWLEYTVNVTSAGSYTLDTRIGSTSTGSLHVEMDGANISGAIAVPNTNGWQTWQNVSKTVTLTAGQHVMRVVIDGGNFNLNKLTFTAIGGIVSGQIYRLTARHSGKVLDVSACSVANGANVQQWTWIGGGCQRWKAEATDNGYYRLTAQNSNQVLEVSNAGMASGDNVQQWPWSGAGCQQWKIEPTDNGYYKLTARHSGLVLDVSGVSTADGANVHQWGYLGAQNQQWKLEVVGSARLSAEDEAAASSLQLSPNPASDVVNLSWKGFDGAVTLNVVNAKGQSVHQQVLKGNNGHQLKTAHLAAGLYVVSVQAGKVAVSEKLLVTH